MDDDFKPRPLARWYMPAAVASMLFMAFGCVVYLMHLLADPSAMPLDQRAAYQAEPMWLIAANAISVWVGLAGTVMLVLRKKLAEPALGLSLAAALVWLAGMLLVTNLRENMSANDLLVGIIVTALTWTIFWFARHSSARGWLR